MIRIENVHHELGGQPVLNGIDLVVPRGGVTALIGPNGAGKSTLLSLVARLARLQRGRITVDDLTVGQCDERTLARHLAIMPQSTEVAARLRVGDLVGFGRYPWCGGRPGPADHEIAARSIARLGLAPLADRFLDEISGGQRQRALVAMAHAQDTPYLLLDEPLNNLDIAAARSLMTLLRDMARTDGKTIVIVLHDINFAAAFADRIIAMKSGRVVADGTPDEVVRPSLLSDVFGTDAGIARVEGRPVVLV